MRHKSLATITKNLQLLASFGPEEFIEMDIFGPLSKTIYGTQDLLVFVVQDTKLTKVSPVTNQESPFAKSVSIPDWVIWYSQPTHLLISDWHKVLPKFFTVDLGYLVVQ